MCKRKGGEIRDIARCISSGDNGEKLTKTCNETMLRDKLRVFVSRISPP